MEPNIEKSTKVIYSPTLITLLDNLDTQHQKFDWNERPDQDIDKSDSLFILVLDKQFLKENKEACYAYIQKLDSFQAQSKIILISQDKYIPGSIHPIGDKKIDISLPPNIDPNILAGIINNSFETLRISNKAHLLQSELNLNAHNIARLIRIGQSLAEEHDFEKLLELILKEAKGLVSADSGSIYVVENFKSGHQSTHLRFKTTSNSIKIQLNEFLLPIDKNSIAGWVALTGQVVSH